MTYSTIITRRTSAVFTASCLSAN